MLLGRSNQEDETETEMYEMHRAYSET